MTATAVAVEARPVRTILREFITEAIDGEDDINRDQVLDDAISRFEDDDEFKTAAARDVLAVMVPDVLQRVIRDLRVEFVQTAAGAIRRTKLEQTAGERLAKVFEATDTGYRSFLMLKKRDLLDLNERDEKDIATRRQWIGLRTDFAKRMNATQTVNEAFTGPQLDMTWRKYFAAETVPPPSA